MGALTMMPSFGNIIPAPVTFDHWLFPLLIDFYPQRAVRLLLSPQASACGMVCTPGMGISQKVQVLSEAGHSDRSELQLRKGDRPWEGSGERNRRPTNRNRI